MRRVVASIGLGVAFAGGGASNATAQAPRCLFQIDAVGDSGRAVKTATGTNYFAGGGIRLSCRGSSISMASDSVASYEGRVVEFVKNVKYRDSTLAMDAKRGTYFKSGERWEARGDVVTKNLETGSTLKGPSLDYLRALPGVRDTFEMYAVNRPRIAYVVKDSTGGAAEPYLITADRIRLRGDHRLWAGGKVTIDRSDFAARGDSLRLDTGTGSDGTLLGKPVLRGLGTDTFTLSGNRIDFKLGGKELTYVSALGHGRAVNAGWDLVADTIGLDVEQRKLQRTVAWGDSVRPYATSARYAIRADSLDLATPAQQLDQVRAYGRAWVGGVLDSASKERDWLAGDSVLSTFQQRDSAGQSRTVLRAVEAYSHARAYYRVADEKRPKQPSLNYARGDVIRVRMKDGDTEGVDRVDVRGQVDGLQLQPKPGGTP